MATRLVAATARAGVMCRSPKRRQAAATRPIARSTGRRTRCQATSTGFATISASASQSWTGMTTISRASFATSMPTAAASEPTLRASSAAVRRPVELPFGLACVAGFLAAAAVLSELAGCFAASAFCSAAAASSRARRRRLASRFFRRFGLPLPPARDPLS